jgi:hypothetical protein
MARVEQEAMRLGYNASLLARPISWGAVFAGVVVTLALQSMLSVLGVAIGAGTFNPGETEGFGVGAGLWFIISAVISLFIGGWVAGRLSGAMGTMDSTLHGVLTWGLSTLIGFWLITTALGNIIGGAANIMARATETLTQQIDQGQLGGFAELLMPEEVQDIAQIRDEAEELLRTAARARAELGLPKEPAAQDDSEPRSEIQEDIEEFDTLILQTFTRAEEQFRQGDREEIKSFLQERADLDQLEAQSKVQDWEERYQQAYQELQKTRARAGLRIERVADDAASNVALTATWLFFIMLLSAIAAGLGGLLARRRARQEY